MTVRWVFRRGPDEVTIIKVVRRGAMCLVSTIGASGSAIHERLPTVIEAVLRQANHERQLVGLGWHLARFDHGVPEMTRRSVTLGMPRAPRSRSFLSHRRRRGSRTRL